MLRAAASAAAAADLRSREMSQSTDDLEVRRATAQDKDSILVLMCEALGWEDDPRYAALFSWKHESNPFGPSPAWVALRGDEVVGLRTFMRWEFLYEGEIVRAVRAVDTATHPSVRGRGVFSLLTLGALDELVADGVDWVFNTPNDQSMPGYLKMGWKEVGRLPLAVRPQLRPRSTVAMFRSRRAAADLWPVLAEGASVSDAIERLPPMFAAFPPSEGAVVTNRSVDYLRWRYGFEHLGYRAVVHPEGVARGCAIVRLRRRGRAMELSICDLLTEAGDEAATRDLVREVRRSAGGDYCAAIGRVPGLWRIGARGPTLTVRSVSSEPPRALESWQLALGDVELF